MHFDPTNDSFLEGGQHVQNRIEAASPVLKEEMLLWFFFNIYYIQLYKHYYKSISM